tara:strand:- start:522 stop:1151 length:630 start_codon:yes stop_codon:yes gene_type:complete
MALKLQGSTSGSATFDVPASVSGDINFTLPNSDGTAGQSLSTNGSGILGWTSSPVSADYWFMNVSQTSAGTFTSWARPSTPLADNSLNMTVSSGEFAFPSSGYYLITFSPEVVLDRTGFTSPGTDIQLQMYIQSNSAFTEVQRYTLPHVPDQVIRAHPTMNYLAKVPDNLVGAAKVMFTISGGLSSTTSYVAGGSLGWSTATFIRLGNV